MNAKLISIAAALVLGSGAALAAAPMTAQSAPQLPSYVDGTAHELALAGFTGRLTREQVRAELMNSKGLPSYVDGSTYENALAMFMSRLTREQVRNEAQHADRYSFEARIEQLGGRN